MGKETYELSVEFGQTGLTIVVEDQDGVDHDVNAKLEDLFEVVFVESNWTVDEAVEMSRTPGQCPANSRSSIIK